MLQVLCRLIVGTVLPKKLQRGVSWGGIDIGFLIFSDELLQRACFAKLWWRTCSAQAITLKTSWWVEFVVFSPGGRIPPAPLTFTSGCLYVGNLIEWFSNKRAWAAGSDARNVWYVGCGLLFWIRKMTLTSLMCLCTEWFYGTVPCVVLYVTWVIARVIIDAVLNISSSVILKTTGPKPLPKRFLHIVRSTASSFNWQYPLLSLR